MKNLLLMLLSFISLEVFALPHPHLKGLECKKGKDVLTMNIDFHRLGNPLFNSVKLNGSYEHGISTLASILETGMVNESHCKDFSDVSDIKHQEVVTCHGEVFVPYGAYGNVYLTKGAIEVFKKILAPHAGWKCKNLHI